MLRVFPSESWDSCVWFVHGPSFTIPKIQKEWHSRNCKGKKYLWSYAIFRNYYQRSYNDCYNLTDQKIMVHTLFRWDLNLVFLTRINKDYIIRSNPWGQINCKLYIYWIEKYYVINKMIYSDITIVRVS